MLGCELRSSGMLQINLWRMMTLTVRKKIDQICVVRFGLVLG